MTFIPPAGYPASTYEPPTAETLGSPPAILADKIDPLTGDIVSLLEGVDPTDAAIQWQFTIEQVGTDADGRRHGGAANGANGHRLYVITKATAQAPIQIADEGTRVLQRFVDAGDISVADVRGDTPGGSTAIRALAFEYTNHHTNEKVTVP